MDTQDFFSFPEDTIIYDCANELRMDLFYSLQDEDGYIPAQCMSQYGDQLDWQVNRDVDILAAYAEDVCRFCP